MSIPSPIGLGFYAKINVNHCIKSTNITFIYYYFLSRVQKAIVRLIVMKKRQRLSQLRDETRSSRAALLHALKLRQHSLLQAVLGCIIRDKVVCYYNTVGQIYQNCAQISFKLSRMRKNDNIECSRVFIWQKNIH